MINQKNLVKQLPTIILYLLVLATFLCVLNWLLFGNKNNPESENTKDSNLSKNFVDSEEMVLNNANYKKSIMKENSEPAPNMNGGKRVNFHNSKIGYPITNN